MSDPAALRICNEALLAIGEAPLDDLDGDTAAHQVCSAKYQPAVDMLLGGHPWTFNRAIVALSRLAIAPPAACGFSAGYQLPGACFRIIAPYVNGDHVTDWGQAGATLFVDANLSDVVELEYHTRVDEALWRPGFRQAVVAQLAAEFCIPVTDDTVRAGAMMQQAERVLARARHLNATEKPAIRLPTGRLAALRRR